MNELLAHSVELAWRQWTTLGIAGVKAQESNLVVDPEALIVFTALLHDADPRLRDESTDWCVRYGPKLVSTSRLKNLAGAAHDQNAIDEYFATVNANSAARWPVSGHTNPRDVDLSGKSSLPRLKKSAPLLRFQLRAMVGVSARAEVLMAFLTARPSPEPLLSASDLELTGYSRRNIAFVLEDLALCELLVSRRVGNQMRYRLNERVHLAKLAPGALAASTTRWDLRLQILARLLTFADTHRTSSPLVQSVEVRKLLSEVEPALDRLDLSAPTPTNPHTYADAVTRWGSSELVPKSFL